MKNTIWFVIVSNLVIITSCTNKNSLPEEGVATIGDKVIKLKEVDFLIEQELYADLYHIYFLRKTALEVLVKDKVLLLEAKNWKISVDQLIDSIIKVNNTAEGLEKFIKENGFKSGYPKVRGGELKYIDVNSKEGKRLVNIDFNDNLISKFVDSLKHAYSVKISLPPPPQLKNNLNKIKAHYRGNTNSKVTVYEISDFECYSCIEANPIFKEIFELYKDKVRFGYSHLSSEVSLSARVAECASNQGKFWQMHDSIFDLKRVPDSLKLISIAQNLNLDMAKFNDDLNSTEIHNRINSNINYLKNEKFYGTPTLVINNNIIHDSYSREEIINTIEQELKKNSSHFLH